MKPADDKVERLTAEVEQLISVLNDRLKELGEPEVFLCPQRVWRLWRESTDGSPSPYNSTASCTMFLDLQSARAALLAIKGITVDDEYNELDDVGHRHARMEPEDYYWIVGSRDDYEADRVSIDSVLLPLASTAERII